MTILTRSLDKHNRSKKLQYNRAWDKVMVASQDPQAHSYNLPQNMYFVWPVIPLSTKEKSLCSLPAEGNELIFGSCDAEFIDLQVTDFVSFYRRYLNFFPNQKAA